MYLVSNKLQWSLKSTFNILTFSIQYLSLFWPLSQIYKSEVVFSLHHLSQCSHIWSSLVGRVGCYVELHELYKFNFITNLILTMIQNYVYIVMSFQLRNWSNSIHYETMKCVSDKRKQIQNKRPVRIPIWTWKNVALSQMVQNSLYLPK